MPYSIRLAPYLLSQLMELSVSPARNLVAIFFYSIAPLSFHIQMIDPGSEVAKTWFPNAPRNSSSRQAELAGAEFKAQAWQGRVSVRTGGCSPPLCTARGSPLGRQAPPLYLESRGGTCVQGVLSGALLMGARLLSPQSSTLSHAD